MEIDPRDKAFVDHVVERDERRRSTRSWVIWLCILAVSYGLLYLFNHDYVSGWFGNVLAIAGIVGVFLFLAFLSTKPFGHGDSSIRWWWFR